MIWPEEAGLRPERPARGGWRLLGRRQAGFPRRPELGKGAPGGFVPVLAAGRWRFARTQLGCRSVASWDWQRARDPPGQWGGGKVPGQGRRVTRSLARCGDWRGCGDAQLPGAGLVCRSSTAAQASGQPASPAGRTELSVDHCVGGRRTGSDCQEPGWDSPSSQVQREQDTPCAAGGWRRGRRACPGSSGMEACLPSVWALPLKATTSKAHPRTVPGAASENPLALSHIPGACKSGRKGNQTLEDNL